jgi:hypothetical protein
MATNAEAVDLQELINENLKEFINLKYGRKTQTQ